MDLYTEKKTEAHRFKVTALLRGQSGMQSTGHLPTHPPGESLSRCPEESHTAILEPRIKATPLVPEKLEGPLLSSPWVSLEQKVAPSNTDPSPLENTTA
jgi:hypothetical protein